LTPTTYRQCCVRGCPNLVLKGRCSAHAQQGAPRRPTTLVSSYAWQQTRKHFLAQHPDCEDCGAPATQADHRIPTRQGGTSDESNLAARCASCHSRKTAARDGGFGNPRR
jgi:5-methylcytosine-specific restriction protein A